VAKLRAGLSYAFSDLLKDIGGWLLLGIGIAGTITALITDNLLAQLFEHQNTSLLVMLLISIPLYMSANASTPIAAALVLKGLFPGAALVFLLAGPATNAATITVVARHWGRVVTLTYMSVIITSSLAFGWLLNLFYHRAGLDIRRWVYHPGSGETLHWWSTACAVVLLGLIFRAALNERHPKPEQASPKP